jgi:hypothetical protein
MATSKFGNLKPSRPAHIYRLIAKIQDPKKRNLIRGYSAKNRLSSRDVSVIRNGNSPHDSMIVGGLLKGPDGLLYGASQGRKKTSADLYKMTSFSALDWRNEVCYTAGYLNSVTKAVCEITLAIAPLSRLELMETEHALGLLLSLSKEYGASNFLSYKLAYLRSARALSDSDILLVSEIEDEINHRDSMGLHFSALENVGSKISLFVVAQRRVSGLIGRIEGSFRSATSLSNIVPTPLNEDDVAAFLLRATESSLVDTVSAAIVLLNLENDLPSGARELDLRLDPTVRSHLSDLISFARTSPDGTVVTDHYHEQNLNSDGSLDLYRVSAAFLERPEFAAYRSRFDRVIGARLLMEILDDKFEATQLPFDDKALLLSQDVDVLGEVLPVTLDTFYRTYLFLRFIRDRVNLLSLSKDEIKFIFENTLGLEALLTEKEMRAIYLTAPPETKGLVAVLALALFRKKSIDPDIDFEFRTDFIGYVNEEHNGSIVAFIENLLEESPQVANYIVGSLDEVTLEKMYTLVRNASEAARIRSDILKAVGQKLNRIEYFIEADAITTRSKVSKLQQYFDSSRMYVDSVSMKKWLDGNPSIFAEQYRSLMSRGGPKVATVEERDANIVITVSDQSEYLVSQISKDAFEQFCLNTEFGIQSYLGRRIRHNTLDGVTTDTVDAVFRKPEFAVAMSNPSMRRSVDAWLGSYKSIVDKLRRDHLQFKAVGSLFKSTLDLTDPTTQENIRKLATFLQSAGGTELLNDLVIAFCWRQISPQLEHAARFIRTTLLRDANSSIDKYFNGYHGAVDGQIKAELHDAVNEVFKKVADWFQVPQTGFISASAKDLCEIILIDLNLQGRARYSGNAVENKYTGISVHRLYDCLAVLLQNAQKYGEENSPIQVEITASRGAGSALEFVEVDITSKVPEEEYSECERRILAAIDSSEAGADMVTEGYTGIKKLKFITRMNEGAHTVRCEGNDEAKTLTLGFSMLAEAAPGEDLPQADAP